MSGTRLHPHPGYPFDLEVSVEYALGEDGLTVTTTARNVGAAAAPYGAGQHPYLSPGTGTIDACALELPAAEEILVDAERQLPCGRAAVDGGPLDFREPREIGDDRDRRPVLRPAPRRRRSRDSPADGRRRRDASSCGWTSATRCSRSSRATRSPPSAGARGSASSR